MGLRGSKDGLIGTWVHGFDEDGDIVLQAEILSRTGDGYICRVYSMEDGMTCELKVIPRKQIIDKMKIYSNAYCMNMALEKHWQQYHHQAAA
jgi:hypothetical protein